MGEKFIRANSDVIGNPLDFTVFPPISLSAHFMGSGMWIIENEQ